MGMFLFITSHKGNPALEMRRRILHTYRTNFLLAGKFREAMQETRDETLMTGQVQIDGLHLSGKIRKGRTIKRPKSDPKIPKKYAVQNPGQEGDAAQEPGRQHRSKFPRWAGNFMPNRRIGMVFCQVSPNKGEGSTRVLTAVIHRETAAEITALTKQWVAKETMLWTDECPGFANLKLMGYGHETVNHSIEFSSPKGVNNNQAESVNSRIRRAEFGIYHRITPKYMDLYLSEMAWRENTRRMTTSEQFTDLGERLLRSGKSKIWTNYARGPARKDENLFWIGDDPRLSKPKSPYSRPTQTQNAGALGLGPGSRLTAPITANDRSGLPTASRSLLPPLGSG